MKRIITLLLSFKQSKVAALDLSLLLEFKRGLMAEKHAGKRHDVLHTNQGIEIDKSSLWSWNRERGFIGAVT